MANQLQSEPNLADEGLITFRSFQDPALAEALAEALHEAGLPVRISDSSSPVDPLIIGSGSDEFIQVLLRPRDFPKAEAILDELARNAQLEIPEDYYLYSFSRSELEEVIRKPDEWNALDVRLAQNLLEQQGIAVTEERLLLHKRERIKELSKPETVGHFWRFAGFFAVVSLSPLALFWGLALRYYRKTLPDGNKVFAYDASARTFGGWMIAFSATLIALRLIGRIYYDFVLFGWTL